MKLKDVKNWKLVYFADKHCFFGRGAQGIIPEEQWREILNTEVRRVESSSIRGLYKKV